MAAGLVFVAFLAVAAGVHLRGDPYGKVNSDWAIGDPKFKKGVALIESSGYGKTELDLLNVVWYYNYDVQTAVPANETLEFVPQVATISSPLPDDSVDSPWVLGWNEPDKAGIDVATALALWPNVSASADICVSPAVGGDPVAGDWLPAFMNPDNGTVPAVDIIAVHWYKGPDPSLFINDMHDVYEAYKRPIWVTEFAAQNVSDAKANPDLYDQNYVVAFMQQVVAWMEATPWLQAYAWADSVKGTSALFKKGGLSVLGKAYSKAKAPYKRKMKKAKKDDKGKDKGGDSSKKLF